MEKLFKIIILVFISSILIIASFFVPDIVGAILGSRCDNDIKGGLVIREFISEADYFELISITGDSYWNEFINFRTDKGEFHIKRRFCNVSADIYEGIRE